MTVFILIGTGERVTPFTKSSVYPSYQKLDTEYFYHTTLFSDDEIPHRIRRNYTLQLLLGGLLSINGGPVLDSALLINTTFMHKVVSNVVNSLAGDSIHLKSAFEALPGPTLDLILSWE